MTWVCQEVSGASCAVWVQYTPPPPPDVLASLSELGITAGGVTQAFAWGFGTVVGFWALGLVGAAALKLIRMA